MKYSYALSALALAASANAHAIMQRITVDGKDQGQLTGLRAPSTNNPVQDYTSTDILCGADDSTSDTVITIPAGSAVGAGWAHVLGGPQGSGDADNPIASSHHGPTQVYLAKVDDAATAAATGLSWFKIASDSVTSAGVWGVDTMIANVDANGIGWQKFTLPECIAPGQYLMRVELLALHSASSANGAQFYQSCAQIKVTGSGSFSPAASDELSLPGGYSATDPGILANIYDTSIYTSYVAPGPDVITCGASSGGAATSKASSAASSAAPKPSSTTPVSVASSTANPVTTSAVTSVAKPVSSTAAAAPSSSAPKPTKSYAAPVSSATVAPVQSSSSAPVLSLSASAPSSTAVAAPTETETGCTQEITITASAKPTTFVTHTRPGTSAPSASAGAGGAGAAAHWERCGGIGHTGPTSCASGFTCKVQNPYYSQCL